VKGRIVPKKLTTGLLPDPQTEPTVDVPVAAQVLGISRATAYEAVRRGEIPAIRLGKRRVVVPTAALLRLLGHEPPAGQ
jgi:excisionase family DNA binding protein